MILTDIFNFICGHQIVYAPQNKDGTDIQFCWYSNLHDTEHNTLLCAFCWCRVENKSDFIHITTFELVAVIMTSWYVDTTFPVIPVSQGIKSLRSTIWVMWGKPTPHQGNGDWVDPYTLIMVVAQAVMCLQCRRPGFDLWIGKIPWRREWLPTPVFLPGESHGQRTLAGYSPWGHKESNMTEQWTLSLSFSQSSEKIQYCKFQNIITFYI